MSETPPLQRYKLTVAYDGTGFHGWQRQEPPGKTPLRTVAGEVEKAIAQVVHQRVSVVGASRTDAGVHAKGQVAHFDAATTIPIERMAQAINSKLPRDAEIVDADFAPPGFDAISDATSKQYRYRCFNSRRRPLLKRLGVWHCWVRLDIDRMNDAASRLIGTHDVAGLAAADHGRLTTVRTIFDCFVEAPEVFADEGPEVHIVVTGSGFLYNMVRIIAGTLVEVGRGRFEPGRIDEILATANRALAGPTLPPEGLSLEWVKYEGRRNGGTEKRRDEGSELDNASPHHPADGGG
ncbi:MAG: tRNA pseudouridine(38-40) synthase TruA [Phycisphaeraceae bacterium]